MPSPVPRDAPTALRLELAASIDRTLQNEARRNEQAIASVRVATLAAMVGLEVWLVSGPSRLGDAAPWLAALTFGYLAVATGLWAALKRGWWAPWIGFLAPVADAAYTTARVGAVYAIAGIEHVNRTQELATITALACLLAVSGAFRLQLSAVGVTTTLGLGMYVVFAAWSGLELFHAAVHLALISATGLLAGHLTRLVSRAVHSEVTRLTLRRLLPASVLDAADADPMALLTQPRSLDATVVVTDLRGFTTWAEGRSPLEVLAFLNAAQGALAATVAEHGGVVDKFMGDGMLAVFGAPQPVADHADRALAAVQAMLGAADRFAPLRLGVGVHSGELVVGCVGSGIRMEFTILGDTVNTASRLESATKDQGVSVLVSGATRARSKRPLRAVGHLPIRGRSEQIEAFTLE